MKVTEFFKFAEEMSKAIEPMVEEIERGGSEKLREAYLHAALAFRQIAAVELKDKLFLRDTVTPGEQTFYVFSTARELDNFLKWNVEDSGWLALPNDRNAELQRAYFDDFTKASSSWVDPRCYQLIDNTPRVVFNVK